MTTNWPEPRYRNLVPSADWEPKSDFFKAIMEKARYHRENKRVGLTCPHCGETLTMNLSVQPPLQRK